MPLLVLVLWAAPANALKDQRDTSALFSALNDLMQFAAPGRGLRWENPETGNSGDVTVIAPGSVQGRTCWDYERTYEDDGLKAVLGTACELEVGLWEIVQEGQPYPKSSPGAGTAETGGSQQAAAPTYDRDLVRETQSLLTQLNYNPGPVDGAFGPRTGRAVSAYQLDRGLPETGEPSQELLDRMRQDVAALRDSSAGETITPWDQDSAPTQDDRPWLEETTPPTGTPSAGTPPAGTTAAEEELPWLSQPPASGGNFEIPPPPPPPEPVQ